MQFAGRQALDELRQMVGVLRGGDVDDDAPLGPQPGLDDLDRWSREAARPGWTSDLHAGTGGAAPVDPVVGRAAYRIVQEALTNARQARARRRGVRGRRPTRAASSSSGSSTDRRDERCWRAPGGGFGLVGLGERVRTLGGRLTAEPRLDGGFGVEAVLPA